MVLDQITQLLTTYLYCMYLLKFVNIITRNSSVALLVSNKAFDSFWRAGLWSKFLNYNMNGKILQIIKKYV